MGTSYWITGPTRSGKTTRLLDLLSQWGQGMLPFPGARQQEGGARVQGRNPSRPLSTALSGKSYSPGRTSPMGHRGALVFTANGDNRMVLAEAILSQTKGQIPFDSTTPLGFFESEINLFWPLVVQNIDSTTPFPLRLRPETEQELATRLWQAELEAGHLQQDGVRDYYMVRRTLDLLQLAASAGVMIEDLPSILKAGLGEDDGLGAKWDCMGTVLQRWSHWCLTRGLLTYGLISDLYWRVLLPQPTYQTQLCRRYGAIFADDVDEYPAIAHTLFDTLLDQGIPGVFTFNPGGGIRRGLGADPDDCAQLAARCEVESLAAEPSALGSPLGSIGDTLWQGISQPFGTTEIPASVQAIQTVSRAELLRQVAAVIHQAIVTQTVAPQEIAIVGPGVDAIARYALREMLGARGIGLESLNEQRAIASSALVRALLTLMGLVYPGLGRLIRGEDVAECLVILSQRPDRTTAMGGAIAPRIDPVRAGLIVDHCFEPDPLQPQLLPVESFPRWDRLGYQGTQTYSDIRQWLQIQQQQQQQRLLPSPVVLLDRAIQYFLAGGSHLPYDRLAILRELMETAQHYWEVDTRLRQGNPAASQEPMSTTVGRFIQLLRDGTITADPYPTRAVNQPTTAVTLATLFQYRAARLHHRWQFWLDAGSPLWLTGGEPLFGAPLLLRNWSGQLWTEAEAQQAREQRLRRNVVDLLGRTTERVYLCHSDLATGGYEQVGPMIPVIDRAIALPDKGLE
ncbi:MAG: recombinase family protein [Leptolyngbyaceae bacterium]|nr:recombinase family protein [Leptolyngbyaceae bacterium]